MNKMFLLYWIVSIILLWWVYAFWSNQNTSEPVITDTDINSVEVQDVVDIDVDTDQETQKRIYSLWDSLTAWYNLPLEDSYPSQLEDMLIEDGYAYTLVNGWLSWDTSAGLLSRLDRILTDSKQWDIALLVIGANDGMRSLPLSELEKNLEKIIGVLQDKWIQVVLWGMQIPTNLAPEYREQFASIYPRIATLYNIPLIPFFLENVATIAELNLADRIHPTKQWYAIIAEQTKQFLITNNIVKK